MGLRDRLRRVRDEPTIAPPQHAQCAEHTPDAGGSLVYCRACEEWYCRISCFSLHKERTDATA